MELNQNKNKPALDFHWDTKKEQTRDIMEAALADKFN